MVSYYNSPYSQKLAAPNLSYPSGPHQPWFPPNYHPAASNQQFLSSMEHSPHHQSMYYNAAHMFHQTAAAADLYSREGFQNLTSNPLTAHSQMFSLQQQNQQHGSGNSGGGSSSNNNNHLHHNNNNHNHSIHQHHQHHNNNHHGGSSNINGNGSELDETSSSGNLLTEGNPSPPINNGTNGNGGGNGGSSEMSSPGIPNAASSPQISNRPIPSPHYEWMKKPAYASQPNPGKTRTKDKYRVVYTDFQRLELEKEYHTSRYITIRRKTELAQGLQLSERQVKIWFQNRRAKERKQSKKRDDTPSVSSMNGSSIGHNGNNNNGGGGITGATPDDLVSFMESKPKLEAGSDILYSHHHQQYSFHPHHHHHMMGIPSPMSVLQNSHLVASSVSSGNNSSSPVTPASAQHMQLYQKMNAIETIS